VVNGVLFSYQEEVKGLYPLKERGIKVRLINKLY